MTLEHGRTRYTRGCRCSVCKAAERDYQRDRYRRQRGLPVDTPSPPKLSVVDSPQVSPPDSSVVAAVRAELDAAPAAVERPRPNSGGSGVGRNPRRPGTVATQPAAARQLVAILGILSKRTQRGGKLAVVKSMTANGQRAD